MAFINKLKEETNVDTGSAPENMNEKKIRKFLEVRYKVSDVKKIIIDSIGNKRRLMFIMVAITIAVILMLSGGRSFEDTVDDYTDAFLEGDAEKIVGLLHDSYISELIVDDKVESKKELILLVQRRTDWYNECAERKGGADFKFAAEIKNISDREIKSGVLDTLESLYGDDVKKISAVKEVVVYYTLYCDEDDEYTIETDSLYFVKIGKQWYLGYVNELNEFKY